MPTTLPVPTKNPGDVLTSALWNSYVRDNINKLLNQGHRVLTVAQFGALTGIEDGDEVYLEVDAANGIIWHLRYVAAEPTYKWRYLGGPPIVSSIATAEMSTSATYAVLTTPGPAITTPRAGDFDVELGFWAQQAASHIHVMSYDIGAAAAVDADSVCISGATGSIYDGYPWRRKRKTGLAAAASLTAKYKGGGGQTPTFGERTMTLRPVRIV